MPRSLYRNVQLLAKQENRPTAEVVRELLAESIGRKRRSVGKGLMRLADINAKGPPDLSQKIDEYLYDE